MLSPRPIRINRFSELDETARAPTRDDHWVVDSHVVARTLLDLDPLAEKRVHVMEEGALRAGVVVIVGLSRVLRRQSPLRVLIPLTSLWMFAEPVAKPHRVVTPRGVRAANVEDDQLASRASETERIQRLTNNNTARGHVERCSG
jgi:hypothetical protein